MRIRSVETAIRADVSRNIPNGVDALGIFDNLVQPIFPFPVEYFLSQKWKDLQCSK